MYPVLPFPRGSSASQGATADLSSITGRESETGANFRRDLEGFTVTVQDSIHGTNLPVTLLAVQVATATVLNKDGVHGGAAFDTTDTDYGRQLASDTTSVTEASDGGPGVFVDDAYSDDFAVSQYDWVWTIIDGPVYATITAAGSVDIASPLAFSGAVASGQLSGVTDSTSAGDVIVGHLRSDGTSAAEAVVIACDARLKKYDHS